MLNEISQRKSNNILFHSHVKSNFFKMNKQNRSKLRDAENKLMVAKGGRIGHMGKEGEGD